MELIDLPLAVSSGSRKYHSDDVDKPTRFYGIVTDIALTVTTANNVFLRIISNTEVRDGGTPDVIHFMARWGYSPRSVTERQNPFLITLDSPILVPDGITVMLQGPDSSHIRYTKVFVER